MRTILDLVKPTSEAKWVVFYSLGDGPDKGRYYDVHPIEQMSYDLKRVRASIVESPQQVIDDAFAEATRRDPRNLSRRRRATSFATPTSCTTTARSPTACRSPPA